MPRNLNDKPGTVRIDPTGVPMDPSYFPLVLSNPVRKQHTCLHRSNLPLGYWSLVVSKVEIDGEILKIKITCQDCESYWVTEIQA